MHVSAWGDGLKKYQTLCRCIITSINSMRCNVFISLSFSACFPTITLSFLPVKCRKWLQPIALLEQKMKKWQETWVWALEGLAVLISPRLTVDGVFTLRKKGKNVAEVVPPRMRTWRIREVNPLPLRPLLLLLLLLQRPSQLHCFQARLIVNKFPRVCFVIIYEALACTAAAAQCFMHAGWALHCEKALWQWQQQQQQNN